MQVTISPAKISGTIKAPASKSSMQRACAGALLFSGKTIIQNPGNSNDDNAALNIIIALGAKVSNLPEGNLQVISNGIHPSENTLDCGESGLCIRMFTPLAAIGSKQIVITGKGSLLNRPMDFFDEVMPKLEVEIKSNSGKLPIRLNGPLIPANLEVDGSLSSQFLTGLLMAYSYSVESPVSIKVINLKSRPYIDLTLKVMKDFGLNVPVNDNYESFHFYPAKKPAPSEITYTIEGDWSGAAFLLVGGAIAGKVTVTGLDLNSTQADKAVLQALMDSGCILSISDEELTVSPGSLQPFHFNASHCPDLFPPLVALAAHCKGKTVIEGLHRLIHKESNRALTLQQEFGKMGVEIMLQGDLMIISGGKPVNSANVHSHHDHRIAMACAVAALKATGEVKIEGAEAINKSYPGFFSDLATLGAEVNY